MSFLAHVLEFVVILGAVGLVVVAGTYLLARRMVRRRWHTVRTHVATRGVLASISYLAARREQVGGRASPEELGGGPAARVRRNMWIAVDDAQEAVQHAEAMQAPIAELPSVCRSLRSAAGELDRLLALERRLPLGPARPQAVRTQVAELIRAARDVQAVALGACSDVTEPQIRTLVHDARDEVEIVAAALQRMRSITPRTR